jgi:hypothetical protein
MPERRGGTWRRKSGLAGFEDSSGHGEDSLFYSRTARVQIKFVRAQKPASLDFRQVDVGEAEVFFSMWLGCTMGGA